MEIFVVVVVLVLVFLIVSFYVVVYIIVFERFFWIVLVFLSLYRFFIMFCVLVCLCDLVVVVLKLFEEKKLLGIWFGFVESKLFGFVLFFDLYSSCI